MVPAVMTVSKMNTINLHLPIRAQRKLKKPPTVKCHTHLMGIFTSIIYVSCDKKKRCKRPVYSYTLQWLGCCDGNFFPLTRWYLKEDRTPQSGDT